MSRLKVQRLDGGIIMPSVTWRSVSRKQNGITSVSALEGKGPQFEVDNEVAKLRGVTTNWGIYKEHSLTQGAPGIYDSITITFQALIDPPIYLYDYSASLVSIPLASHPGYRTYWDHDLISIKGDELATFDTDEMNEFQLIKDETIPDRFRDLYTWRKTNQAIGKGEAVVRWEEFGNEPTSGHTTGKASKPGITSAKLPTITVRETVYFIENQNLTFNWFGTDYTIANLNTKTLASMSGKAGWPLHSTFGYPRDTYALLNDPTIYDAGGKAISSDYSDYRNVGKLLSYDSSGSGTETITDVVMEETFFRKRGIPTDNYLTPLAIGAYSKNTYGHPLWLCRSCTIKKIGYWYEATLSWDYYGFGIDASMYPVATARVNGLA